MIWKNILQVLMAGLIATVSGCGWEHSEENDHDHGVHADSSVNAERHADEAGHEDEPEHDEGAGAEYDGELGLLVHEEARAQINLQSTEVTKQKLTLQFTATAQVFQQSRSTENATATARASAIIPVRNTKYLNEGDSIDVRSAVGAASSKRGRLVRLDEATARAIGQVEAIIEIQDSENQMPFGTFLEVTFHGVEQEVIAIPKSAVVDAASGTFAYVPKDERFLKTPITVGASGMDRVVEIIEGLSVGDRVVSEGAVGLWLMELRFTKGGGHTH